MMLLLIDTAAGATYISEIMYDFPGSDNNQEYVEIYSDMISIDNMTIGDEDSNDTLEILQLGDSNYHLVVEEGYDYSSTDASVYSAGATIGNTLSNTKDTVFLYGDGLIDQVSYDGTLADGNGFSLTLDSGSWIEANPTPGYQEGSDEPVAAVPEFSTLGAAMMLILAGFVIYRKRGG